MKLTATDKKLQNNVIRFLMVDSQQMTFNAICQSLEKQFQRVQSKLLDDLSSFEKMLNLQWDVVIFHNAYDFNYAQALTLIDEKEKNIPVILLSDLDPKSPKGLEAYQLGIYEIADSHYLQHLNLSIYRASIISRLTRREQQLSLEIDKLQQQTQTLVENTEYPLAVFQEGVHVSTNLQYTYLFGGKQNDEFLGLPVLDILQPSDISEFKQAFQRLSRGDFSHANFKVSTQNPQAKEQILSLQFAATEYEDEPALQLVIIAESSTAESNSSFIPLQAEQHPHFATTEDIHQHLQLAFGQNQSVGLALLSFEHLPTALLTQNWDCSTQALSELQQQISTVMCQDILRISENVFLAIQPVSASSFQQNLKRLIDQLPIQIHLNQQNYKVDLNISSGLLNNLPSLAQIQNVLDQTFRHQYDANELLAQTQSKGQVDSETTATSTIPSSTVEQSAHPTDFGQTIAKHSEHEHFISLNIATDGSQQALLEQIENNSVQLYFQQLYDKEDIDTHIFEVTASFQYEGKAIEIEDYSGLESNHDLAQKIDRWVLVEASKRLHQFLTHAPKARIVVNLHAASLNDSSLLSLLSKLVNLVNSKYTRPLILQFQERDLLANLDATAKLIRTIQDNNIATSIVNFGESLYCANILEKVEVKFAKLHATVTAQLLSDDGLVEIQAKLDAFKEHHPSVQFLMSELNDMTSFANAWNVDARYLQGDYFQAKQSEFIDSAT